MSTRRTTTEGGSPDVSRREDRLLRSPILLLTAGAVIGAVIVIAVLAVAGGLTGGLGGLFGSAATITPQRTNLPAPSVTPTASANFSIEPYVQFTHSKPADLAFGRSLGSPDAPVKLDIWIDYQCPACRQFTEVIEPQLVDAYISTGKARLNARDFSFLGDESVGAAMGARCADRQGHFWPYHDLLFANQAPENSGALTPDRLLQFAAVIGLDTGAFAACIGDQQVLDAVALETGEGSRLPVVETPYLLANGVVVKPASDWTAVSAAIESALAGGSPQSPGP